jgi:hypothetical protein
MKGNRACRWIGNICGRKLAPDEKPTAVNAPRTFERENWTGGEIKYVEKYFWTLSLEYY